MHPRNTRAYLLCHYVQPRYSHFQLLSTKYFLNREERYDEFDTGYAHIQDRL